MGRRDKAKARREAAEVAAWRAQRHRVLSFLDRVRTFLGATNADGATLPLQLLEGEHALLVLPTVQLIEPRRLPSHFMGGNSGFTFHVARGTGDEETTPIDRGVVMVTDRRAVFSGSLHTRTWDFADVIGYHSNDDPPWTAIAVSDRQKVSGVRYDIAHAEEFRFALALGLARFHKAEASLVDDLNRQLEELDRERPRAVPIPDFVGASSGSTAASIPVSAPAHSSVPAHSSAPAQSLSTAPDTSAARSTFPPPGWYPDPYRTARLRWWDGHSWTGHAAP